MTTNRHKTPAQRDATDRHEELLRLLVAIKASRPITYNVLLMWLRFI
jgi:hypothetical protein